MSALLKIDNLECTYQKFILAISGVSLSVKEGQILGLLGTNGAGKTTTVRCVMGRGVLKPLEGRITKGSIQLSIEDITGRSTPEIVKMGISLVPEGRGIFEDMTVEENLKVGAHTLSHGTSTAANFEKIYSYFPALETRKDRTAGYLSGGEQQMLAIGRALMAVPKVLILDEPSLGLAPLLVEKIFEIVKTIRENEEVSILLIEQNASVTFEIADYVYIMENGIIVTDDVPEKLKETPEVREFYLGISSTGHRKDYRHVKTYKKRRHWFS